MFIKYLKILFPQKILITDNHFYVVMADQVDRTRQIGIVILDAVVMGIVVLTVVLRFIARQFIVKKLGADDWLMLAATVWFLPV